MDSAEVRIGTNGEVSSTSPSAANQIAAVLSAHGLVLKREIGLAVPAIQAIIDEAELRSGREQPDLFGIYRISFPTMNTTTRQDAIDALLALDSVEYIGLAESSIPPPSITPLFEDLQEYFWEDEGVDVDYAASQGLHGEGMQYVDIEYCWIPQHEELTGVIYMESDQDNTHRLPSDPYCSHGAAATGMISAIPSNGIGIKGMASAATAMANPEEVIVNNVIVTRRTDAIYSAINRTNVGDVILLEMQGIYYPQGAPAQVGGPAEFDMLVYQAVRVATDAGRIVVAAAGNGNLNLGHYYFSEYRNRDDSGALIIGAGYQTRNKATSSTYGDRVNLQAWGRDVVTLGTGDLFSGDGVPPGTIDFNRSYTSVFSHTSSASAMVAGAALLLQQKLKAEFGSPFNAIELRELLRATGRPQTGNLSYHIGPRPDLEQAITRRNEADARLVAATSGNGRIQFSVDNLGPSRAVDRTLDIRVKLLLGSGYDATILSQTGMICNIGPSNELEKRYLCEIPEMRFGQSAVSVEVQCVKKGDAEITAALTTGGQTDSPLSNNSITTEIECRWP